MYFCVLITNELIKWYTQYFTEDSKVSYHTAIFSHSLVLLFFLLFYCSILQSAHV